MAFCVFWTETIKLIPSSLAEVRRATTRQLIFSLFYLLFGHLSDYQLCDLHDLLLVLLSLSLPITWLPFLICLHRFPNGRWLGKGVDDGALERLLVAEPVSASTDANELMEKCRTPPRCRSPSMPRRSNEPSKKST